nr:SGNH/GDSL hydrolase family protein [bacterium]
MSDSIYLLGDSVAAGVYMNAKGRYQLCEQGLPSRLKQQGFEVHNLARMGAKVSQAADLANRALPDKATGRILVCLGGNDCDFDWADIGQHPESQHTPNTPLDIFCEKARALLSRLRQKGLTPTVLVPPPIDSSRYFATFTARGADGRGVMRWLGHLCRIHEWQELYAMAIGDIGREAGCPVINVRSRFLLERDYRQLLCQDGIHPNAQGYQLLSDTVLGCL